MPLRKNQPPTDEEILAYQNVPVEVAAKYIGWSPGSIRAALREKCAPYGCAASPKNKQYAYHISPGLLVKYQHGELPAYPITAALAVISDAMDGLIDAKMESIKQALNGLNALFGDGRDGAA